MRFLTILFSALLCTAGHAATNVSVYIGEPQAHIGVNLSTYPEFVRVPAYPVYYAPRAATNIFFYDGLYWVYDADRWYASTWYNGPWSVVGPEAVPVYILRVPVRYYAAPPAYFRAWAIDAPPRWDVHWGSSWAQTRIGWNQWNRSAVPAAAPLPVYQRAYSGDRYPRVEQQLVLQTQKYSYQPRDTVVQQYYREQVVPAAKSAKASAQSAKAGAPGQVKHQQGAQAAKEFAPGQVKKQQGVQSAKELAPGHVKKQEVAQSTPANGDDEPEARGQGHGQGHGQGQGGGKGKGHGKD